ncbi:BglG family transcription antiterminator [Tepidibacillus sp. LV47]|uniref:BglG family transcription antiterminator n=1 Tax=Tepidibacillus sp. LV47 TaxID=3398228 RepID=UPI003AAC5654
MNERQKQLLIFLLKQDRYVSVVDLAKTHHCSEKTIRNDFKEIDRWLAKYEVQLIRKPNYGVYLLANEDERKRILNEIGKENILTDDERKKEIIKILLLHNKEITIQDLTKNFHVSKAMIREDLEYIEKWLHRFGMHLMRKRKAGVKVEGEEREQRIALANIIDETSFEPYEIAFVKNQLANLEESFPFSFTDEALEQLTLHIMLVIKRMKLGKTIKMEETELNNIYKLKEYPFAKELAECLKKSFVVDFPPSEIAYIASHLAGAKIRYEGLEKEGGINRLNPITLQFTKSLIEEVAKLTGENFLNDRELFMGLAFHLQSALNRIKYRLPLTNPMLHDIKKMYRYMFEVILSVLSAIEKKIKLYIPEDEIAFIVLHFQASLERLKQKNGKRKKAIIACHMGIGMSQLLKTKLERKFNFLEIVDAVSVSNLQKKIKVKEPDLIISTVPITHMDLPIITISPLLSESEQRKLEQFLLQLDKNKLSKYSTLKRFIQKELLFLQMEEQTPEKIIEYLADQLIKKGFVTSNYKESAIQREQIGSTFVGGEMAIPHGDPNEVFQSVIAVGRLKEGVNWNGEKVKLVFMLATKLGKTEQIQSLFHEIASLVENEEDLKRLKSAKTAEDFLNFF